MPPRQAVVPGSRPSAAGTGGSAHSSACLAAAAAAANLCKAEAKEWAGVASDTWASASQHAGTLMPLPGMRPDLLPGPLRRARGSRGALTSTRSSGSRHAAEKNVGAAHWVRTEGPRHTSAPRQAATWCPPTLRRQHPATHVRGKQRCHRGCHAVPVARRQRVSQQECEVADVLAPRLQGSRGRSAGRGAGRRACERGGCGGLQPVSQGGAGMHAGCSGRRTCWKRPVKSIKSTTSEA